MFTMPSCSRNILIFNATGGKKFQRSKIRFKNTFYSIKIGCFRMSYSNSAIKFFCLNTINKIHISRFCGCYIKKILAMNLRVEFSLLILMRKFIFLENLLQILQIVWKQNIHFMIEDCFIPYIIFFFCMIKYMHIHT